VVQPYVVDTSILIQGYIREVDTARVRSLLQGAITPEPTVTLHAPEFCILECANILWKRVIFHNKTVAETEQALANLLAFPLAVHSSPELLSRALTLGIDHQLAIYDSIYLALAERLACPLITADERQAKAAESIGVTLKPITDFAEFSNKL
jgi:predicted nucleic acid-binding protein